MFIAPQPQHFIAGRTGGNSTRLKPRTLTSARPTRATGYGEPDYKYRTLTGVRGASAMLDADSSLRPQRLCALCVKSHQPN